MAKLEQHPYQNQTVILATMHGKEQAIQPAFEKYLYLSWNIPSPINTDQLGTFSGEVERKRSILETLRKKINLGFKYSSGLYGLSSEGSFGPHPWIPFLPQHHEAMMWIDLDRKIEIVEQLYTQETNYGSIQVAEVDEHLTVFLDRIIFPSHAVIVSPNRGSPPIEIYKGLQSIPEVQSAIHHCAKLSVDGWALVQTDMRAHMNPTRMRVIGQLAERLANRIMNLCPHCRCPGWGAVDVERGLPCEECGMPTQQIRYNIYRCPQCVHEDKSFRIDGAVKAKSMHCEQCNP